MLAVLLVALGGGVGAATRYLVSMLAADRLGTDFPYGTLIVNVVGSFIIGAFMVTATERLLLDPYWRLLVIVGFVGGMTTFSSFSYETFKLGEDAGVYMMFYNILANLILGFLVVWLGMALARVL